MLLLNYEKNFRRQFLSLYFQVQERGQNMKEVLSFISLNNPFGYLPLEMRKLIESISSISSTKKTYFFLNDSYLKYMALVYCFTYVKKNLELNNGIDFSDLNKGQPVIYKNKSYKYVKLNEHGDVVLIGIPSRKKSIKYSQVTETIPIKYANKHVIINSSSKQGLKFKDIKEELGKIFRVKNPSKRNTQSILIVCPGELRRSLEDLQFSVGREKYFFSEICPSHYYPKYSEKSYPFKHDNNKEIPIAYFTGSLEEAVLILERYEVGELEKQLKEIVILGDKYFINSQSPYFNSLISYAEELEIPFSFYGVTSRLLEKKMLENISQHSDIYAWTPAVNNQIQKQKVKFHKVGTNSEFMESMEVLNRNIEEISQTASFWNLYRLMTNFRRLVFAQLYRNEDSKGILISQMNKIGKTLKNYRFDENEVLLNMKNLIDNRYVYNVSKVLHKLLFEHPDAVLVVEEEYINTAKSFIRDSHFVNKVVSSKMISEEDLHYDSNIVFAFIRKKYLAEWLLSGLGTNLDFIYPFFEENFLLNFLKFLQYKMKRVDDFNQIMDFKNMEPWKLSVNAHSEKQYNQSDEKIIEEVELMDFDTRLEETTINQTIEKFKTTSEFQDISADRTLVEISRIVLLESGSYILATSNSKFEFTDERNILYQKKLREIDEGDKLIAIDVPYSNELHYRTAHGIAYLLEKPYYEMTQVEKDEFMDWQWKNALREYADKYNLNIKAVYKKFENLGYKKSLGFFQNWLDQSNQTMLPRDPEFIMNIGKLTADKNIEENYLSYYRASERLKQSAQQLRISAIKRMIGMEFERAKNEFDVFNFNSEIILEISRPNSMKVERVLTNRILKAEGVI